MDAGVPIKAPVAGIAMGLIERVEEDGSSKMAILSDIQGMEDFLGDMDFKVAGTAKALRRSRWTSRFMAFPRKFCRTL